MYRLKKIYNYLNDRFVLWKNRCLNFSQKRHIRSFISKCIMFKYLVFPFGKKVYVLGTPDYTNMGDSAITLAETEFIRKSLMISPKRIKELTNAEYFKYRKTVKKVIRKKSLICGVGGGNMGNYWYNEELFRYELINDFSDNPIVIFPQTIFYTNDDEGEKAEEKSADYYGKCRHLTIVAREQISYHKMRTLYKNSNILLTPDIVLSADRDFWGVKPNKRKGILLCLRTDTEKMISDEDVQKITNYLCENNYGYQTTDMYSDCQLINRYNRYECVKAKMEEFVYAELVITDRLHAMIFSIITQTPCIVLDNCNYKIKGTYEWIKYLPYIRYISQVENIEKHIEDLLNMKNCQFDSRPLAVHFEKLAEVLKDYAC